MCSRWTYQVLNSLRPGYVNAVFKEEIAIRLKGKQIDDNFIEVRDEFSGLLDSEIFKIDSGRFVSMLKKR